MGAGGGVINLLVRAHLLVVLVCEVEHLEALLPHHRLAHLNQLSHVFELQSCAGSVSPAYC